MGLPFPLGQLYPSLHPVSYFASLSHCQDYTVCAASINESANSNPFSIDKLGGLPRNFTWMGCSFILVLSCVQTLHYLASRFHNCSFPRRMIPDSFRFFLCFFARAFCFHVRFATVGIIAVAGSIVSLVALRIFS